MSFALSTEVDQPVPVVLERTRQALAEQGFGVLTEIDIAATLKSKLGVDVTPHVILGACRPQSAHAALQAEPSISLLLPCNVVVRAVGPDRTLVEAVDPQTMVALTGNPALQAIADDASERLSTALASLQRTTGPWPEP